MLASFIHCRTISVCSRCDASVKKLGGVVIFSMNITSDDTSKSSIQVKIANAPSKTLAKKIQLSEAKPHLSDGANISLSFATPTMTSFSQSNNTSGSFTVMKSSQSNGMVYKPILKSSCSINRLAQGSPDALSAKIGRLRLQTAPVRSAASATCHRNLSTKPCDTTVRTIEDVVEFIKAGRAKSVVVMVGAGISTASGIPDFRSPGTGLYDNLLQYRIPYPEAIFDLSYFHVNPRPFFTLAKELYPTGKYRPNLAHYFLRLLHEKGLLLQIYTQNIDGLERLAGIPDSKLMEAHGSFLSSSCTRCKRPASSDDVKAAIFEDKIPRCQTCRGVVKPDIVFFGEDLPPRFYSYKKDFTRADILLVLGTSLEVEPFASIADSVRPGVPRVLFNRDLVGPFRRVTTKRPNDVPYTGDIVQQVRSLVDLLGWAYDLDKLLDAAESESCGISMPPDSNPQSLVSVTKEQIDECLSKENTRANQQKSSAEISATNRLSKPVSRKIVGQTAHSGLHQYKLGESGKLSTKEASESNTGQSSTVNSKTGQSQKESEFKVSRFREQLMHSGSSVANVGWRRTSASDESESSDASVDSSSSNTDSEKS